MDSIIDSLKTNLAELKELPQTSTIRQAMTHVQRAITLLENAAQEES